jgi:hypothetical protein
LFEKQGEFAMKLRLLAVMLTLMMLSTTTAFAAEPEAKGSSDQKPGAAVDAKTASAVIVEKDFSFASVVDGSEVAHDYLIKNTGEGTLEISRVKTG